ncbi:MAG TPA: MATE family efflux transporter [Devosiaceae bacterium]|jgi:MATE family multidrug resistance protein
MSRPSYPFEVHSRDVWRIALPAALAFITEPMVGTVDIAVVGRLGDANLLGGLVLGALVFDFIFSLAYFLRLGTAGLTAQAIGSRDPRDGLIHICRAVLLAVAIGLLMIALSVPLLWVAEAALAPAPGVREALATYFHIRLLAAPFALINYGLLGWFYGRAAATTGMALQILIHGVNIVLNILFVFGFGWGVAGAALGTVLGEAAAAVLGLYLVARHFGGIRKTLALIVPKELYDPAALRRIFGLSRDLMIRSAALMSAYAYFAAQGSRAGEITLSSNAILLNLMMVSAYFLDGVAQASEQLCGKAVGANWRPAFERAAVLAMGWGLVIATGLALLIFFCGPFVIDVMTTNAPVREAARQFLPLAAISAIVGMPAFVYDGILTGSTLNGEMRNGMVAGFAIFLIAANVLQPMLGNSGLWLALNVLFVSRAAFYFWALERKKAGLFTA